MTDVTSRSPTGDTTPPLTTIWKFAVDPRSTYVWAPAGARFLSVQVQGNSITLWALVNPDAPPCSHPIAVIGTGHPAYGALDGKSFLGTVQHDVFVWHVFVARPTGEDHA